MGRKLLKEEFLERVNIIHNNKYNYELLDYKNNDSKIKIICPIHGLFFQNAKSHLDGHGCFKCKNNILTTDDFIYKSKIIHNDKYNYELSFFKTYSTKTEIICPIHGIFYQSPKLHLKGHGCSKCANNVLTKNDLLDKAKIIHNNKYRYKDFIFNKRMNKTMIEIECPKHGIFYQRLNNHIHQKNGCPLCSESKGEKEIESILIKNNIYFERQKSFEGCKNVKPLFFDFFLKQNNICIEFDGIQHFQPIYGKDSLNRTIINDRIKNEFCINNNITLLRIKYSDNIHEKMSIIKNNIEYINEER